MRIPIKSRADRAVAWLRDIWVELDYAQRRMFELRTGIPPRQPPPRRTPIDELETLYSLEAREPGHRLD
jgi:hypothetical protein